LEAPANILVLDRQADEYGGRLKRAFPDLDIRTAPNAGAALSGALSDVDVLVAFGLSITDDLLRAMTSLRWIQALGTGVDYFQRSPALRDDVILTSARGIHGPALREHVIFLTQAVSRLGTPVVLDSGRRIWTRNSWPLLHGKTALIFGTGIAGTAIAEALSALGMTVVGVTRMVREIGVFHKVVALPDAAAAVSEADYIINVLPGGADNKGLFDQAMFAAMRPAAFFINVGRGDTVDEQALARCLSNGALAGAALDVFQDEPLPNDSPFWGLKNVVLTPHVGGYFNEYIDHVLPVIVENITCYRRGRIADMRNRVLTAPATRSGAAIGT
jgi:D-2-hydroxyacid dehydrogenase (NADP+)